jgi:basic membrane protein A
MARWATEILIDEGSDVVFQAAGYSGIGVFDAVASGVAETGSTMWAIGVDADEYVNIQDNLFFEETADFWTGRIATSIVKDLEIGVLEAMKRYVETGTPQTVVLSVENGGVDYVTTGGFIDHIVTRLDTAKQALVDGSVALSHDPPEKVRMLDDVIGP